MFIQWVLNPCVGAQVVSRLKGSSDHTAPPRQMRQPSPQPVAGLALGLLPMALKANALLIIIAIATSIAQRYDVVHLTRCCNLSIP